MHDECDIEFCLCDNIRTVKSINSKNDGSESDRTVSILNPFFRCALSYDCFLR